MLQFLWKIFLTLSGGIVFLEVVLYAIRWMEIMNSHRITEEEKRKPYPITWKSFRNWLIELSWTALTVPFWLLQDYVEKTLSSVHRQGEEPVLFIHGFSQNASNGWRIMRALRAQGYSNLVGMTLMGKYGPLADMAPQVAEKVEELCLKTQSKTVTIIAHSMGGIVARYYIQRLEGNKRVRRLITLGTPHKGSKVTALLTVPAAKDMLVEGAFLENLNADVKELEPTELIAMYSPFDAKIVPWDSALHPGQGRNVEVGGVGHLGLLFDPRAVRVLVEIVKEGV